MSERTVLVTGANGFAGRAIVSRLLDEGIHVRATDIGKQGVLPHIPYHQADITRPEAIQPAMNKAAMVIHAAGLAHIFSPKTNAPGQFRLVNETGTANVTAAAAAAGVEHLILISSVSVYGAPNSGFCDETMVCRPEGPYAISKYHAELKAIEIARKTGMSLTVLRLATLYGEEDPGNIGRLIHALASGRFIWIGNGVNRKSLLYKDDAACACLAVVRKPASGIRVYNVSAPPCAMHEIVGMISEYLRKPVMPVRIPATWVLNITRLLSKIPQRQFTASHLLVHNWLAEHLFDTHRFEHEYDFRTKMSLANGLKKEVQWYRQVQKMLKSPAPIKVCVAKGKVN